MTQQTVREKIEAAIDLFFRKNNCGYSVYEMNVCLDQILAYFSEWAKEAGFKSQEDCETCFGKFVRIEEQTIQKIYDAFGGEAMTPQEQLVENMAKWLHDYPETETPYDKKFDWVKEFWREKARRLISEVLAPLCWLKSGNVGEMRCVLKIKVEEKP